MKKGKRKIVGRLMTIGEVVDYLRLGVDVLYKMAQQDRIPAFKVANKWRFRRDEIDSWIEKIVERNKNGEIIPERSPVFIEGEHNGIIFYYK
jgi:excisionase family DNA binding protein